MSRDRDLELADQMKVIREQLNALSDRIEAMRARHYSDSLATLTENERQGERAEEVRIPRRDDRTDTEPCWGHRQRSMTASYTTPNWCGKCQIWFNDFEYRIIVPAPAPVDTAGANTQESRDPQSPRADHADLPEPPAVPGDLSAAVRGGAGSPPTLGASTSRRSIHDPCCDAIATSHLMCNCEASSGHHDGCALVSGFEVCDCDFPHREMTTLPTKDTRLAIKLHLPNSDFEIVGARFVEERHDGKWLVQIDKRGRTAIEQGDVLWRHG
jgi:hypothetical protein